MLRNFRPKNRSSNLLRIFDYLLGIPIIWFLAFGFKSRKFPNSIAVIGLIQPTAIGDLILASNLFDSLHKKYPNAKLVLFCGKSNFEVADLISAPLEVVVCNFKNPLKTISRINKYNTDLLIDLVSWSRATALISFFSNTKYSVGFDGFKQHRSKLYDKQVQHQLNRHEKENFLSIADSLRLPVNTSTCLKLPVKSSFLKETINPDKCIVFHLEAGGSMAKFKSWPNEKWVQLGKVLCSRGYSILFSGTQKDKDKLSEIILMIDCHKKCVNLAGLLNISELAVLLSKVRLVVSIDTGILHLASWVNAPVLGLHGPTSSSRWGLLNSKGISINSPHKNAGYMHFGYERSYAEKLIMDAISVEMVLNQVDLILR